jgi:hypothetical protein
MSFSFIASQWRVLLRLALLDIAVRPRKTFFDQTMPYKINDTWFFFLANKVVARVT